MPYFSSVALITMCNFIKRLFIQSLSILPEQQLPNRRSYVFFVFVFFYFVHHRPQSLSRYGHIRCSKILSKEKCSLEFRASSDEMDNFLLSKYEKNKSWKKQNRTNNVQQNKTKPHRYSYFTVLVTWQHRGNVSIKG